MKRFDHLAVPGAPVSLWTVRSLFWPERPPVSAWAEASIVLSPAVSAEPGPLSLARTPYLREPLDAFGDPDVTSITLKTSTQVGKTMTMLLMVGYAVDQDPGPALFVMPVENQARDISNERMRPILTSTPVLRRHFGANKYDVTLLRYRLDRMTLHFAWAGSASELASRPKRYLWFDETNKYPRFSGQEADPIKLGEERQRTYTLNRKSVKASTPTTRGAYIDRDYRRSDQRRFHVPCPLCEGLQPLEFGRLKWPEGERDADQVRAGKLAWYECKHCGGRIPEQAKVGMVAGGRWVAEGASGPHRGYWLNALYSPWLTFSDVAAEFLDSRQAPELLMNFVNSWLAEEWEEEVDTVEVSTTSAVDNKAVLGVPPAGTVVLLVGVDVQKDHVWYTVRAWQEEEDSQLVESGRLQSADGQSDMEQVADLLLRGSWTSADGTVLEARAVAMDSRYRRNEVLALARQYPERVFAVQGSGSPMMTPYTYGYADKRPGRGSKRVRKGSPKIWNLDTGHYKTLIARLMRQGKFRIPSDADGDYQRQIQSEHKIVEEDKFGRKVERWEKKPGFDANHLWDAEVYETAIADVLGYWRGDLVQRPAAVAGSWFSEQVRK